MTTSSTAPVIARRAGGVAGLAFACGVLLQNGYLLQGNPMPGSELDVIAAFYRDRPGHIAVAVGWVALNVPLLLLFASHVADRFARSTSVAPWGRAGFGAVVLLCGAFLVTTLLQAVLVARIDALESSHQLALVWDLHTAAFAMSGISLAAALGSFSVAAWIAGEVVPRWAAGVGVAGALSLAASGLLVVPTVTGGPGIFFQLAGFLAWVVFLITASVRMLRGR